MFKVQLDDVSQRTLPRILQMQAQHNGDQRFLLEGNNATTFAEAEELSNRLAIGLAELGVQRADNVALYLENSTEMVLLALAINKLGAIWVPINTEYHGAWLESTLDSSQAKTLITTQTLWSKNQVNHSAKQLVLLDGKPLPNYQSLTAQTDSRWQCDYDSIAYGDTASIMWTSGTTGKSKGVMVSHNNWLRPIIGGSSVFYQSEDDDIILNVLPMYHAAAWNTAILRALVEGIPAAIEKRFSVSNFFDRVNHYGATQSFTLGAMHMFLWNTPTNPSKDQQHTLRKLQAVPMPADIKDQFEKRFGVQVLGSGFGQSECMMVITEAGFGPTPPNSMGFAARDVDVKLFDDNDNQVAPGEAGEIRVRPHSANIICNGYFNDPIASKAAWKGEWFCTGDMAKQVYLEGNPDPIYYFSDRKKDSVRYAGRNISTLEVESVVRQYPDIADLAAFGIPSQEISSEDELMLAIVLDKEVIENTAQTEQKAQKIARFINDNAPYYFVPRYIEFVEQLPYTPTNKVQKFKLREQGLSKQTWDRLASDFELTR